MIHGQVSHVKLLSYECYWALLMINQYWFTSGNGLVTSDNKPLPEQVLTQIWVSVGINRSQWVKCVMNVRYLNQCKFVLSEVLSLLWHSPEGDFTVKQRQQTLDCIIMKLQLFLLGINELTCCGILLLCGNIDLGWHWFRQWPIGWWHQAIT